MLLSGIRERLPDVVVDLRWNDGVAIGPARKEILEDCIKGFGIEFENDFEREIFLGKIYECLILEISQTMDMNIFPTPFFERDFPTPQDRLRSFVIPLQQPGHVATARLQAVATPAGR